MKVYVPSSRETTKNQNKPNNMFDTKNNSLSGPQVNVKRVHLSLAGGVTSSDLGQMNNRLNSRGSIFSEKQNIENNLQDDVKNLKSPVSKDKRTTEISIGTEN